MKPKHFVIPLLTLPLLSCGGSEVAKVKLPNVVLIYADDIGFGDLSMNISGTKTILTPNVEKLANQGIRFTNAHSTAAMSTPSRYSMLTGEYAWRHEGTGIAAGNAGMIIRPEKYTMADMFQEAGYKTGVVGKWHLGLGDKTGEQDWNQPLPMHTADIGFDYSYIMAATGDRVPCVYVENGMVVNLDPADPLYVSYEKNFEGEPTGKDNPEMLTMGLSQGHAQTIHNGISRIGYMKGGHSARWNDETIADVLTEKAVKYIEDNKDEPFFLYFATQDAHVPRVPSPRFAGKSGMGVRGDVLLQFDWSVGEILATLERLGLDENTIVILSSDNGPVVDDGYADQAKELLGDHKPAGPFRGGKYSSFEGGTRVPTALRWKGTVEPGVSNALLCHIDWFASFASLLNFDIPEGAAPDSENNMDTWVGKAKEGREYLVTQNIQNNLSLSSTEWKYIYPHPGAAYDPFTDTEYGNTMDEQLYSLTSDEGERKNVAADNPAVVADMKAKLKEIMEKK